MPETVAQIVNNSGKSLWIAVRISRTFAGYSGILHSSSFFQSG
jgi:hypothetical protein